MKALNLLLSACMVLSICACGNDKLNENHIEREAVVEVKTATQKPVAKSTSKPKVNKPQFIEVTDGEVKTGYEYECFIEHSKISKRIMPPQPKNYYSYYDAENGNVFVDVCFAYKNLGAIGVASDEVISAQLKYADKYTYIGFTTIEEDNRGDLANANIRDIEPLQTGYIHYLFEVPQEVETSTEKIDVTFNIGMDKYIYHIR